MMIQATVSGLKNLERAVAAADKESKKALSTGIKVEGARLTRLLIKEIRSGAPGGEQFQPLTTLAKYKVSEGSFRNTGRKPFTRLFGTRRAGDSGSQGWSRGTLPVRYDARDDHSGFHLHLGFVDTRQGPLSKSWKQLMIKHQEGFQSETTKRQRRWFAGTGGIIAKNSPRRATPFFLKKSTTVLRTPARPIVDPFWRAHRIEALKNVMENFRRKMRGERI